MNQQPPILKTLAFFRIFNQPLTLVELWERLMTDQIISWEEFKKELDNFLLTGAVVEERGFFFLRGGENLAERRIGRILWENRKITIAQKAARLLSFVPFIKMAAVCNSLGFGASEKRSDIDFFVVAKAGRLWTVRFLCNLVLRLFSLRTHGDKMTDRICLSFFIDEDNLNLEKMALPEADPYLVFWIIQLIPLINRGGVWQKFWQANLWIRNTIGNFQEEGLAADAREIKDFWLSNWKRSFWERVFSGSGGDGLERFLQNWQKEKIYQRIKIHALPSAVIIEGGMIKLHQEDRREEYKKKWQESLTM